MKTATAKSVFFLVSKKDEFPQQLLLIERVPHQEVLWRCFYNGNISKRLSGTISQQGPLAELKAARPGRRYVSFKKIYVLQNQQRAEYLFAKDSL